MRLAGDEQDPALIDRWGGQTLEHLLALVNSEQAPASGCMSLMGEPCKPPLPYPLMQQDPENVLDGCRRWEASAPPHRRAHTIFRP